MVSLYDFVSQLIIDTKGWTAAGLFSAPSADSSLGMFLPEITLCAVIVLILLLRLFRAGERVDPFWLALIGSGLALCLAAPWAHLGGSAPVTRMEIFTGMLVYDGFTVFMRSVLLLFAFLLAILTKLSGLPRRGDAADIYVLFLGATLGMCLMASANHLLMVFMAVEMASVPSYVLAGMLKGRRQGSEAALKYAIYGAGAAGVMLYGISLISGILNTAHLPTMAVQLAEKLPDLSPQETTVLALGVLMMMVGLAFKVSAVPFHFWCPDVFEGACAEVGAFLSVASKAAALALLVRVTIGLTAIAPPGEAPGRRLGADRVAAAPGQLGPARSAGLFAVADERVGLRPLDHPSSRQEASSALAPARNYVGKLVALLAAITCTFGNLAAYGQTNMKRLLAYSTIAHAGYMLMAIPPLAAMAGVSPIGAERAVAAMAVYIVVYLFMNLGAFSVVAFLRNEMGSEEISDYAGLIYRCPGVVLCLSAILFALVGLPPLSGFIGKFAVFGALVDGFQATSQPYLLALLFVGGVNTAISLFYYLRVVKVMVMAPAPASRESLALPIASLPGMFVLLVALPTLLLILNWDGLNQWALAAASHLLM